MTETTDRDLKGQIRDHYAERAVAATQAQACGCGCSCGAAAVEPQDEFARGLYTVDETGDLPAEAVLASLGCGNPTALGRAAGRRGRARPGQRRRDRRAAVRPSRRPTGKAYGLDMTDEMLALARENQEKAGVTNVEFLKGDIENIPLPDASVDVIISNCVINLSDGQGQGAGRGLSRAEAGRPVRGFRRASSRATWSVVPDELLRDAEMWSGCVAGALEERDYLDKLRRAGFADAAVEVTNVYDGAPENSCCGAPALPDGVQLMSGFVRAVKPSA